MVNAVVATQFGRGQLTPAQLADLVVTSTHLSPVSIEGVALGRVRGTEIEAYFVVYKVVGTVGRIQVNQDLYETLKTVLDTAKSMHPEVIAEWIRRG